MNAPRYGIYAPTNTSAPSPTAPGTPRMSSPTVMQTASISAITVVPRMNPSTARKARRAMASSCGPVEPGASERRAAAARSESRRKKNVSSSASTAAAAACPTTLIPDSSPEAAVPPNFPSQPLALEAMSSREVPAAPKWSERDRAASFNEATISSPVSMSALTTTYPAPPTTATSAAQVSPAARDRCTFMATSRRYNGPSSPAPSSASSTGVTAAFNCTHNHTPTAPTAANSNTTTHQAATRRTPTGNRARPAFASLSTGSRDHGGGGGARRSGSAG